MGIGAIVGGLASKLLGIGGDSGGGGGGGNPANMLLGPMTTKGTSETQEKGS